jgi:hypothetical protein
VCPGRRRAGTGSPRTLGNHTSMTSGDPSPRDAAGRPPRWTSRARTGSDPAELSPRALPRPRGARATTPPRPHLGSPSLSELGARGAVRQHRSFPWAPSRSPSPPARASVAATIDTSMYRQSRRRHIDVRVRRRRRPRSSDATSQHRSRPPRSMTRWCRWLFGSVLPTDATPGGRTGHSTFAAQSTQRTESGRASRRAGGMPSPHVTHVP